LLDLTKPFRNNQVCVFQFIGYISKIQLSFLFLNDVIVLVSKVKKQARILNDDYIFIKTMLSSLNYLKGHNTPDHPPKKLAGIFEPE
jgi:hypothetical protein